MTDHGVGARSVKEQRVVLVAEPGPLCDATQALLRTLPGVDVCCAENLPAARQVCRESKRQHLLTLVLVELQRCKGNGFSLAATLSRDLTCPVILLSDRNDQADHQWSRSRGITFCCSRLQGKKAFLQVIRSALNMDNEKGSITPSVNSGSQVAWGQEKKSSHPINKMRKKVLVFKHAREQLAQVLNETLASCSTLRNSPDIDSYDRGVLFSKQEVMSFVFRLLDRELVEWVRGKHPLQRWKCLQVLKYPVMSANHPGRQLRRGIEPILAWQACEVIRDELLAGLSRLESGQRSSDQQRLRQRLLSIVVSVQALNPRQLPLRWTSQLPALLVHLAASQHDLLEDSRGQWLWFSQRVSVSQCVRYGNNKKGHRQVKNACMNMGDTLPEVGNDVWRKWLKHPGTNACCTRLDLLLRRVTPSDSPKADALDQHMLFISDALYQLMVSVKVTAEEQQSAWQCLIENLLLRSLYQSSRNLVWHDRSERTEGYWELVTILTLLRSGSSGLLTRCLGFEIRLSRAVRSKAVQYRLSGGLHLLPRPDLIASSLMNGKAGSATLVSDLQAELRRLITGAERLGVTWVGALAYALLQALQIESEENQRAARRRLVVRGLYRLCRMLDQAAAWQKVSAASGSINRLLQLRFGAESLLDGQQDVNGQNRTLPQVAELGPGNYRQAADIKDKYQQCRQLNQLIKMVLEEQKLQSGAASTLGRLINEQARLLRDAFSP